MPAPTPAYVAAPGSIAVTSTAKTVLMLIPGAGKPIVVCNLEVSFDASGIMCLVELVESTQATNGTAGTDFASSVKQLRGFAAGDTTALPDSMGVRHTYTSEPTVLTVLKNWYFSSGGVFIRDFPLGREVQSLLSGASKYKGIGLRVKSASNVNCYPSMEWE